MQTARSSDIAVALPSPSPPPPLSPQHRPTVEEGSAVHSVDVLLVVFLSPPSACCGVFFSRVFPLWLYCCLEQYELPPALSHDSWATRNTPPVSPLPRAEYNIFQKWQRITLFERGPAQAPLFCVCKKLCTPFAKPPSTGCLPSALMKAWQRAGIEITAEIKWQYKRKQDNAR